MKLKLKKCSHCGNEFQPTGPHQYYCSVVCRIKDSIEIDNNDCWNWTGYKDMKGYGLLSYKNHAFKPHRVMCEDTHGPSSQDKPYTLHACDNRCCVNPSHLRWGSAQDNMDDKAKRNRGNNPKGEQHCRSKLTEKQVIEIIEKLKNYKIGDYSKLAKEYNASKFIISAIHKNKTWKHLPR